MEIRDLANLHFNKIFHAFGQAFADYEITFSRDEVFSILKRRGFTPELSFAAFEGNDIVAFTLNGTGMYNNIPTAYDTGTGTIKEFRGKGIAQDIFRHAAPVLRKAGIRQYLLEVLQNNEKAIAVYSKLGFEVTREFNCFRQEKRLIGGTEEKGSHLQIEIVPVETGLITACAAFREFEPSWQNSNESITRAGSDLLSLGAFVNDDMAGYCVSDPATGDISQIAVAPQFRRNKIASRLLDKAVGLSEPPGIKVLNIPSSCTSIPAFLRSKNITPAVGQFEMTLQLG